MLGQSTVDPPVVLAPMAGITNRAFRQLCREQSATVTQSPPPHVSAGVFTCEMVMTRPLIERNPKTMRLAAFDSNEYPRSLQLYGVDPLTVRKACEMIVETDLADHIDMNFGCPVPRVTRKGGGAALPWKRKLFGQIVSAAVEAAGPANIPVTVKMRKGIDDDHLTYIDAGKIAEDSGAAWVALHARTASERYSGAADWDAITALKQAVSIPVLGNGDIWEGADAVRMVKRTGCDGVVVGRGCLGRPWLFADLAEAFRAHARGETHYTPVLPRLGEVAATMQRHAELLVDWYAEASLRDDPAFRAEQRRKITAEEHGVTDFRKHVSWYLKGFPVGGDLRRQLAMTSSLSQLQELLQQLDPAVEFPADILGQSRGRTNSPGKVTLPHGWLDDPDDETVPHAADVEGSGG